MLGTREAAFQRLNIVLQRDAGGHLQEDCSNLDKHNKGINLQHPRTKYKL